MTPRVGRALTRQTLAWAAGELARRDRDLAGVLASHGPPPLWGRRPGFATLVLIVLEQQVSLRSARAAYRRLTENLRPFVPGSFVEAGPAGLRALGLTRQKAGYCVGLARAIEDGSLDLAAVAAMPEA